MKTPQFTDEQMVLIVQESEAGGDKETARKHLVIKPTIYTWRLRFGRMDKNQATDYKRLE